ncbi:c-type cytochrome [Ramlibacter rhizophilus]|uniref:C-type cytochrome n=1 Tax=Ramlibacter rhizophilus TaxID=1781167 RepID=A0A4Z0BIB7_9BURK|nr:cytochrome c [Ramlibacter rhizophilus]TFY98520.1 c-type cytochrome [Ramlibacter rhizophilus]
MRFLKYGLYVVLALVLLAAAAVFAGLQLGERKLQRKVDVRVAALAVQPANVSLERGQYLFASRGCVDCHGANGAGRVFVDDGKGLKIKGPNITGGPGGVVARYSDDDWTRAIRHGVAPGGRPLLVMPSEDYNRFTDRDLASLVAYVRSLPPAPGDGAVVQLPLPARVMYGLGLIEDAAAKIDHARPPQAEVAEGVNLPHGQYVANMCIGCHGERLTGGRVPGGPPDWPPAANLRPGEGSGMGRYEQPEAFLAMFRSGKRPDGSAIQVMPFESLRNMSETDVRALHLYLRSLKPQG